jgi:hypothetical protein
MQFYKLVVGTMDGTEELLDGVHCKQLNMLDERMSEDIYILVLAHFQENNKGKKGALLELKELPYGATLISKESKGLKFRVSHLPDDVQRIIVRYLRIVSS